MGHHVHCADSQHRTIHIETMEHMIHIVFFVLLIKKYFFFAVISQILTRRYQETRCTACRITDHIIRLRLHHINNHPDNMSRCAELSIYARYRKLGKQIFIDVSTGIHILQLRHLLVNSIQRIDDLI